MSTRWRSLAGRPATGSPNVRTSPIGSGLIVLALVGAMSSCGGGGGSSGDATGAAPTVVDAGPAAGSVTTLPSAEGSAAPGTTAAAATGASEAPSGEILLEPIGVGVPDPFTPTMVTGDEQVPAFGVPEFIDLSVTVDASETAVDETIGSSVPVTTTDAAPAATTGQTALVPVAGDLPGLYGGTRDVRECDQQQMISFLETNPDKGAAWASVHDIEPSEIREYIEDLTPVVLLRDTRVTNHGFENGRARPHQSVLQAGHAVLVDRLGVPRAKCSCGNPLAPPQPVAVTPDYVGQQWPGFDSAEIIVVVANDAVGNGFVIVDLGTGELITRPIGYAPDAADADISALLDTSNRMGVFPGVDAAPSFTVAEPTLIVAVIHYHYGPETPPGQVGMTHDDGRFYGPWQTTGREGQGGVADAYWTAIPWEIVPAGTYTMWDSEPSTWSTNDQAGGLGFSVVRGVVGVNLPPATGGTPPPEPTNPTEAAAAYYLASVAPYNCATDELIQAESESPWFADDRITADEYAAYREYITPHLELMRDSARHFADSLAAYEWPPDARPLAEEIAAQAATESERWDAAITWSFDEFVDSTPWVDDGGLVNELRGMLGLPTAENDDRNWCLDVAG